MRFSRHRGRGLRAGGLLAACLLTAAAVQARGGPPTGVIAVSAGSRVSVVDPATGKAARFETGPVGWLYPGPGGRLFAPDLVHGKTVVIDLHRRRVVETLSGVTMPRFDREVPDRYLEVAGDVFVFSFPERALLAKVPAKITRPWQVAVSRDWTTILVLERTPGSGAPPVLWTVDLPSREVLRRSPLPAGVTSMAASLRLGVLALADGGRGVVLVDPRTMGVIRVLPVPGGASDVAFAGEGDLLLAASGGEDGVLKRYRLKAKKRGLAVRERSSASLGGRALRLVASPDGAWAAVGLADGSLDILPAQRGGVTRRVVLGGRPRDLEWCDPGAPDPLLPQWSK